MDFAGLKTRFEGSLLGEIVVELVRIEVVERSLALASKLFVAVIPLSIIISAVVPGADNFGDSLVNRLGLTGAGAEATRNLFATNGEIRGAVSVLGVVILLYSVFSFPGIFTTNAERYGLIGVAFGLVTWLFGYAAVVIGAAVVAGTWDHRRYTTART